MKLFYRLDGNMPFIENEAGERVEEVQEITAVRRHEQRGIEVLVRFFVADDDLETKHVSSDIAVGTPPPQRVCVDDLGRGETAYYLDGDYVNSWPTHKESEHIDEKCRRIIGSMTKECQGEIYWPKRLENVWVDEEYAPPCSRPAAVLVVDDAMGESAVYSNNRLVQWGGTRGSLIKRTLNDYLIVRTFDVDHSNGSLGYWPEEIRFLDLKERDS